MTTFGSTTRFDCKSIFDFSSAPPPILLLVDPLEVNLGLPLITIICLLRHSILSLQEIKRVIKVDRL